MPSRRENPFSYSPHAVWNLDKLVLLCTNIFSKRFQQAALRETNSKTHERHVYFAAVGPAQSVSHWCLLARARSQVSLRWTHKTNSDLMTMGMKGPGCTVFYILIGWKDLTPHLEWRLGERCCLCWAVVHPMESNLSCRLLERSPLQFYLRPQPVILSFLTPDLLRAWYNVIETAFSWSCWKKLPQLQ